MRFIHICICSFVIKARICKDKFAFCKDVRTISDCLLSTLGVDVCIYSTDVPQLTVTKTKYMTDVNGTSAD